MRRTRRMILKSWIIGLTGLVFGCLISTPALADSEDPLGQSKIIGVVQLTKPAATANIFRDIDKMVPQLKKISSERVIKLECRYNGLPGREQDVSNAYMVAGKVEKASPQTPQSYKQLVEEANAGDSFTKKLNKDKVRNGYLENSLHLMVVDGLFGKSDYVERGFYVENKFLRQYFLILLLVSIISLFLRVKRGFLFP